MDAEALYRHLGRIIESAPRFRARKELSSEEMRWIGQARALLHESGDTGAIVEFDQAVPYRGLCWLCTLTRLTEPPLLPKRCRRHRLLQQFRLLPGATALGASSESFDGLSRLIQNWMSTRRHYDHFRFGRARLRDSRFRQRADPLKNLPGI